MSLVPITWSTHEGCCGMTRLHMELRAPHLQATLSLRKHTNLTSLTPQNIASFHFFHRHKPSITRHTKYRINFTTTTMASRTAGQAMRLLTSRLAARSFTTSARRLQEVSPLPARKPMGAFRSGSVKSKEAPLVQRWCFWDYSICRKCCADGGLRI